MAIISCEYAVLLDSQVFDAVRLDFDNRNLIHLAELAQSGQVHIVLTSVVVDEVKSHIAREAAHIAEQLKAAGTSSLARGYDADLAAKLSHESLAKEIAKAALARLHQYLKRSRAEVIPVDAVDVGPVFADYFASQPPFGTGKKKSEFPDAFTLHALRAWAKGKTYPVVVVSGDADLRTFCDANPPLQSMGTLATFLAVFPDAEVARSIRDWLDSQWDTVEEIVDNQFKDFSFELDGVDGTVEAARLMSMEVLGSTVVEIAGGMARVAADVELEIDADIYAYPRHWYPEGEGDYSSKKSDSVIDYMQIGIDIVITLDDSQKIPLEIDRVEIVERPTWPRIRVDEDWRGSRYG